MQEEVENLQFKKWIYRFINTQRYKLLELCDNSCADISNSKAVVVTATAWRHRRLRIKYIEQNLFHQSNQSKIERDIELQNTEIVLSRPPCDLINSVSKGHSWVTYHS